MRFLLTDHVHTAYYSLKTNRLRTLLTTIGIAIGVASITTILSLAQGVTSSIDRQIDQIGGNVAVIRPGLMKEPEVSRPVLQQQFNTSSLTESDVSTIKKSDKKLSVAPIMTIDGTLTTTKNKITAATVVATTSELVNTTNLPIEEGQFLDENTSDNVAVIGQQLAIDLFGTENPIGQQFKLRSQQLTVIGTLKKQNKPVNYNNIDFDNSMIINFELGKSFHSGRSQIQQINLSAKSASELNNALPKIKSQLRDSHGDDDFSVLTGKDVAITTNRTFSWIATVMTAIAAISLVVGGIGIMNIMLVGVAERTREIGIRKSVGASNSNIVSQFLIESLMISLLGGLLGVALGAVSAFIVGLAVYFTPIFSWQIFAVAFLVSVSVGVVFGLYPAIRAARKDPIESLRQYR